MTGKTKEIRYPSHTELYRDFHLIEEYFVMMLFSNCDAEFCTKKKWTEFEVDFERNGWDICIEITDTPDKELTKFSKDLTKEMKDVYEDDNDWFFTFNIEYKSSINEWGKQVDDYIRQIKKRREKVVHDGPTILFSFDESFLDYEELLSRVNIAVFVLEMEDWNSLQEFKKVKEDYEDFVDYLNKNKSDEDEK